jgi:hypothetical protein
MRTGGLFDQVAGGFSRYAVDRTWTIPHFEKMLYDNALLARTYLHGWQVSEDPRLRRTCEETLEWMAREMVAPEGGFYSALDADSEGVEGRYYVWSLDELREALGPEDADAAVAYFGVTEEGNFEGANHLEGRGPEPPPELRDAIRRRLYEVREQRVRPGLDDKRLAAWNGLAIHAFAEAGAVLEREDLLDVARGAAEFVLGSMRDGDGRLLRTWGGGRARLNAYLEDHAFMVEALLALYEATFEERWFVEARALGGHDDRPVRRPRARRVLHDVRRPRDARRAAQGARGQPDPRRRVERRARAAAPRRADRRADLRGRRRGAPPAPARARGEAPERLRPSAPGARLPPQPGPRGGAGRRRRRHAGPGGARAAAAPSRARGRHGRTRCRCSRAARSPVRTSARTSRAGVL